MRWCAVNTDCNTTLSMGDMDACINHYYSKQIKCKLYRIHPRLMNMFKLLNLRITLWSNRVPFIINTTEYTADILHKTQCIHINNQQVIRCKSVIQHDRYTLLCIDNAYYTSRELIHASDYQGFCKYFHI
jgi:hypothetical protein